MRRFATGGECSVKGWCGTSLALLSIIQGGDHMINIRHYVRLGAAALAITSLGACAQAGGLGNVLGSVLGGQQQSNNQVSGTVRGVDTRNAQIVIQQSNGQQVGLSFDNQTKIVYNNQNYTVSSLESGDQVTARIQQTQNGGYYTDYVQVDQSVSSNGGGSNANGGVYQGNGQVQSLQGTVRRVDVGNGWFEIAPSNGVVLTVTLPYNVARADVQRFQNLRQGDVVRFNGVYLNNSRVELRQFY
jgi:Cu/Ag efflux protein CusF